MNDPRAYASPTPMNVRIDGEHYKGRISPLIKQALRDWQTAQAKTRYTDAANS
ncbi:hypothetical protein [Micromonospora sp. NBC_01796]|uniref:hypothetical protein n=1 Tax=Micromonospora sp. NBC_01796 TaxID=2975987 RepID=UPI002DDAF4A7|nr:hypothetical protein [Micromonospora sp. NBC_01796]WSA86705.1 hypothetical protein OIE47_03505 [Micromonospora sp. NBC_01796]